MASHHPLMKPLTSESLRPRPSTQAVWPVPAPTQEAAVPAPAPPPVEAPVEETVFPLREEISAQEPKAQSLTEQEYTLEPLPEERQEETPLPEIKNPAEETPLVSLRLLEIEKELDDLLGETADEDDDEAEYSGPDAMPSETMPEPACVPLYDAPPAAKKWHGCLWALAIVLMLAAGGGYAIWHFGLIEPMLAWIQPAFDRVKAFVSGIQDILP